MSVCSARRPRSPGIAGKRRGDGIGTQRIVLIAGKVEGHLLCGTADRGRQSLGDRSGTDGFRLALEMDKIEAHGEDRQHQSGNHVL